MLNKVAFANSLAILTALFYILISLLQIIAPEVFSFFFNAQFLGADVASLLPLEFSLGEFVGILITLVAIAWVFAYLWAWLYNRLAR